MKVFIVVVVFIVFIEIIYMSDIGVNLLSK